MRPLVDAPDPRVPIVARVHRVIDVMRSTDGKTFFPAQELRLDVTVGDCADERFDCPLISRAGGRARKTASPRAVPLLVIELRGAVPSAA